jgi:dihydrofolate reductase
VVEAWSRNEPSTNEQVVKMIHSLIVARARNGVIGRDNGMPWHLPADLAHFKRTTMGCPVIMGRRTWESIGRALPGRRNVVVSRTPGYLAPGAEVVTSLEDAWRAVAGANEAFVIGGAQLYAQALPEADRIYLTDIAGEIAGDTLFPALAPDQWRESSLGEHPADERNPYAMRFLLLERARATGPR